MNCTYPECSSKEMKVYYYQSGYGYVCPTHDVVLGQSNLTSIGVPLEEAKMFDTNKGVRKWETLYKKRERGNDVRQSRSKEAMERRKSKRLIGLKGIDKGEKV